MTFLNLHPVTRFDETLFWENIYRYYNRREFIGSDPILFPKSINGNTEYIGFIASLFAYGRVNAIQTFLDAFFVRYGTDPFRINQLDTKLYYRFQSSEDIHLLVLLIKHIYSQFISIQNFFRYLSGDLEDSLKGFLDYARKFGEEKKAGRGYFFLFPKYGYSGLKRFRMFLRWMVREDEVDFGLWDAYDSSELLYPLDTHILRFAKNFGIINTETNSNKNSHLITDYFRNFNEYDPVKYDFALTRLGMLNFCKFKESAACDVCGLNKECLFN